MPYFIHADLDAFYASVEQLDNPEYRGKPVIVGGLPEDRRSVVSTASYEARKFGVHSAMPIAQAYKLCPRGIFLRGRMGRYREKSDEIMTIFQDFSPDVEQLSIDEAFIDITGTEKLFGPLEETAKKLKKRVINETGLTVSTGLASNKYVAKIASGMSKPDGLFAIVPGDEEKFMRALPAGKIWGAGGKTQELFKKYGLKTCEDIYRLSKETLASMFGNSFGIFLYRAVRGEPAENFDHERGSHSMSAERTFEYDLYDEFVIETALLEICETLIFRLISCKAESATVSLKIRYSDFSVESVRETFRDPVLTLNDFYKKVLDLFHRKYHKGKSLGIRLIGVGFMNLETESPARQKDLFDMGSEKERRLEESILKINTKHPNAVLRRGRSTLAP
jgi:DNA polymerase-4